MVGGKAETVSLDTYGGEEYGHEMAPAGKPVNWVCETPMAASTVSHGLITAVRSRGGWGGYALEQTPAGMVMTRKYFPTWRVLLLGIPAVLFGRKSEVADVQVETLSESNTRITVQGKLVKWMRNDLETAIQRLGVTPIDFAKR
jgi:hypothetical protein